MSKTYYKVVIRKQGTNLLVSCVEYYKSACVIYSLGIWAKRRTKCGPLCVFNDKDKAISFAESIVRSEILEVWKVDIVPSKLKSIWNHTLKCHRSGLPKNTVLALRVKLISLIKVI